MLDSSLDGLKGFTGPKVSSMSGQHIDCLVIIKLLSVHNLHQHQCVSSPGCIDPGATAERRHLWEGLCGHACA